MIWVSACMRADGWVSKADANEEVGKTSTAESAAHCMFSKASKYKPTRDDQDTEVAKNAIEWGKNLDAFSEWAHNVKALIEIGKIGYKHLGLAASIIPAMFKSIENAKRRELENQNKANSEFVGNIKERITINIEVIGKRYIENNFGSKTLYNMVDEEGNILIWWCTNHAEMEIGFKGNITGTVKAHNVYQNYNQTVINRVVIN